MEITEVRVKLTNESAERLRAFCSVTFDGEFVIRDLKVIDGTSGVFLAMPSRKLSDRCPKCGYKNHLRAKFCNDCGGRLPEARGGDESVRNKLHADVAHPINTACRERLQKTVIEAYQRELECSKQPGYQPIDMDAGLEHAPAEAAPPADAPEELHEEPVVTTEGALSEYDELILDLRRSAAARAADQRPGGPPPRPAAPPPARPRERESVPDDRRRGGDRPRQQRPDRRPRDGGGPSGPRPERRPAPAAMPSATRDPIRSDEPVVAAAATVARPAPPPPPPAPVWREPAPTPPPPPAPVWREPAPAPPVPQPAATVSDNDDFGAGLL